MIGASAVMYARLWQEPRSRYLQYTIKLGQLSRIRWRQ